MSPVEILEQAAQKAFNAAERPAPDAVREACLEAENISRHSRESHGFDQLVGDWRLCFITGTKKTQKKAGPVMGAGRYLPKLASISLSYTPREQPAENSGEKFTAGTIANDIKFLGIHLSVSGPAKFLSPQNIMAFDFTRMAVRVYGVKLFDSFIRKGEASEAKFYQRKVGQQAFFAYFLICDTVLAARGRGGGLAVWAREPS
ncbi:hypothetical protein C1752_00505 [Acaryochloris thomasi RCC1774]|uniref:Plastid lipid-associated protein/fibrillin conserved domain-containing protein n=1 Tax=Acaryochloris thomasi RCC1774 TaxID=1764569 RepID=A0A2W1JYK1_9CYAN|nr:hypothetical protein [Acaryochloris thomasi]PZD75315.1 hypothetical protein C1752_00505 [Acaryochloris thomasi RCC1774]